MARDDSIARIKQAIRDVYSQRTDGTPVTQGHIQTAAGVGHATFYRVKQDHPEIAELLDLADAVYKARPKRAARPLPPTDPIKREPERAARELLNVVASLAAIVHEQKVRIRDLETALQMAVEPTYANDPEPRQIAIARAANAGRSAQHRGPSRLPR